MPRFRVAGPSTLRATLALARRIRSRILTKERGGEAQRSGGGKTYRELHDKKAASSIKLSGVVKLLEELPSHGIKTALVSNKGRKGLDHLLGPVLDLGFFRPVLSAEDVRFNKPKPELYLEVHRAALRRDLRGPTRLWTVGDAEALDLAICQGRGQAVLLLSGALWVMAPRDEVPSTSSRLIRNRRGVGIAAARDILLGRDEVSRSSGLCGRSAYRGAASMLTA